MSLSPTGFANASAFGTPSIFPSLAPAGIASSNAFATLTLSAGPASASVGAGIFVTAEATALETGVGDHIVRASDVGYRTAPSDPGGVLPFPARITESIMLSRAVDVSPGAAAAAVAWGAVYLANSDGEYDDIADWSNDGKSIEIKYGRKIFDTTRRYWRDPNYASLRPLFAGVQGAWRAENRALTIPLRDATYWLEQPIQTHQYGGTGGYDGTEELEGVRKPKLRGLARNITPVLIDPVNLIYQYNDGPGQVLLVWEGGVGTFGYPAESDTTNLYSGTTSAGRYRTDNSRGLFQLGTAPTYQITIDAAGHFPVAGYKYELADIARWLLTEDAGLPSEYIDTAEYAAVAAAYPYTGGWYWGPEDTDTGAAAVSRLLVGLGAKLIPRRDGTLGVFVLRALAGTETPVAVLDTSTAREVAARALPSDVSPPPWRIRAGWRRNGTIQTTGLLPAIQTYEPNRIAFVASATRSYTWSDTAVQAAYARPNDIGPVITALDQASHAHALADAWGALWGVRRRLLDVVVPLDVGLTLDIGNVVRVAWPMDDLDAGVLGQIVGDNLRTADSTLTLSVLV